MSRHTRSPKPEARNPKPEIRNPKPETPTSIARRRKRARQSNLNPKPTQKALTLGAAHSIASKHECLGAHLLSEALAALPSHHWRQSLQPQTTALADIIARCNASAAQGLGGRALVSLPLYRCVSLECCWCVARVVAGREPSSLSRLIGESLTNIRVCDVGITASPSGLNRKP